MTLLEFVIVASSWFFYITLRTLTMHGQTQIKFTFILLSNPFIHLNFNQPNTCLDAHYKRTW